MHEKLPMTIAFTSWRYDGRSIRLTLLAFGLVVPLTETANAQVQAKDTGAIRAHNVGVTATAMGRAVSAYVDERNSRLGLNLGARLCGAALRAPGLPIDQRAFEGMARAVGVERRVNCENLAGARSEAAGVIRVDSVSLTLSSATVYSVVTRANTSQHERAVLELVGRGTERRWSVVRIDSLGSDRR